MNWKVIALLALMYGAYEFWDSRPITHGYGVIAEDDPQQNTNIKAEIKQLHDFSITPLATFSIKARVLSIENYYFGRDADLSPIDFALGWGRMSDERILEHIDISQGSRFYYWQVNQFPIPRQEIESHSANMHLVPANNLIKDLLKTVQVGQVVNLEGFLIQANTSDGWRWSSSLTREDTGLGACELVLVNSVRIM